MTSALPIPAWRQNARPGQSLQAARTSSAVAPAPLPPQLGRIIRPEVQQRWLLPQLAAITPTYIENVLRGAMAGAHIQQWELFEIMEDTWPRLLKNLNEIKGGAVSMQWVLHPYAEEGEEVSDSAKERAATIRQAMRCMRPRAGWDENAFSGTVFDILDAWGKGTSVIEIEWAFNDRYGIWAPLNTYWTHPRNYGWTQEGFLGLINSSTTGPVSPTNQPSYPLPPAAPPQSGLLPSFVPYGAVPFPDDKFLVAIRKAKSGHPLSSSLLRPLAWWWCAANFSADWLLNFAQVFGLPFRWANYDPNAPQAIIDSICSMLENMGSNAWAAFPAGTTMELKEASKGSAGSLPQENIIDHADKNCDLLILGQTLTTDVGASGSRALGDVHKTVRDEVIQAAANFAARILNEQFIPAILRLNFGDDSEAPEYRPEHDQGETSIGFKREVFKAFMADGTVVDILANQTDLKMLTKEVGLPINEEYTDPYVPVQDKTGSNIIGDTVKDSEGDVIGAETEQADPPHLAQASSPAGSTGVPPGSDDDDDEDPKETEKQSTPPVAAAAAGPVSTKLENTAHAALARAFASDLQPLRDRLEKILSISDPAILEARLRSFLDEIETLKADILTDPAAAHELQRVLSAGLANGLADRKSKAKPL